MGEVSLQKIFPYGARMCRCAPFFTEGLELLSHTLKVQWD